MGVISRMREVSPYLLALFALVFIGFMVATDADIQRVLHLGENPATAVIGVVNGEKIRYAEFNERVQQQVEQQRKSAGGDIEIDEAGIRQSIWDMMVEEILLRQAAEKAAFPVTREELLDVLLDNPPDYLRQPFTDSAGVFHRERYIELITQPERLADYVDPNSGVDPVEVVERWKRDLVRIEDFLRQNRTREHLRSLVNAVGSIVSPSYVRRQYVVENSSAEVHYVVYSIDRIRDREITISDAEIEAYYRQHRDAFRQKKPARKLKYVIFPLEPTSQDSANFRKRLARIRQELEQTPPERRDSLFSLLLSEYQGRSYGLSSLAAIEPQKAQYLASQPVGAVLGPVELAGKTYFFRVDQRQPGDTLLVHASHILIGFGGNKDSARAQAQEIARRARSGENFAELARLYSQDRATAERGGDLGWFPRGRMVKPFEEAAFAAQPGSIVGPVESPFGFHIIAVHAKSADRIAYSEIELSVTLGTAGRNQIFREAYSFKQQVEKGTPFDTLARRLKKNPVETAFFEETTPVLGSRTLTQFAFSHPIGTVSDPIELKPYGVVVAQVIDERKPGYKPLEDVRSEIVEKLRRSKKLDLLRAHVDSVYERLKGADILARIVEIDSSVQVQTATMVKDNGFLQGYGQDPIVTAMIYRVPVGVIAPPVRGERAYFLLQVTKREVADPKTMDSTRFVELYRRLYNTAKASAYYYWYTALRDRSDIEDRRVKFYREF
ncbi:Foldase protein PrsA 1 [bacterium HR21]|nr:Foldase protein PrsA 1 [bacterium HR21]